MFGINVLNNNPKREKKWRSGGPMTGQKLRVNTGVSLAKFVQELKRTSGKVSVAPRVRNT